MSTDTICAISTPVGEGAIGIVRLSGVNSIKYVKKIFKSSSKKNILNVPTHTIHYGHIIDPSLKGKKIDEVLVSVMRAPKTYTGEDIVEISAHGNPIILERILGLIIKYGARLAEPGEFTKKAFLNGRMDLTQAEAVIDLIKAKSDKAAGAAIKHLSGDMSIGITELQESLRELLILLEVGIDFPEDHTDHFSKESLSSTIEKIISAVNNAIRSHQQGVIIKEGVKVAIIGKANVGKSSLFNILSGKKNRALVTHIPGTTRDIIEQSSIIQGKTFSFLDTAGVKTPKGKIESKIINLTKEGIRDTHCNIMVLDASKAYGEKSLGSIKEILKKPTLIVLNKIDLKNKLSLSKAQKLFPKCSIVEVSCKTKNGINSLKKALLKLFESISDKKSDNNMILTNIRHKQSMEKVKTALLDAQTAIKKNFSVEFIASDVRIALENLQQITGETVSEDILNEIFSRFCIGK